MVSGKVRSRFLLFVSILLLNAALHVCLWLGFSVMSLPDPASEPLAQRQCHCPSLPPPPPSSDNAANEPVTCGLPPKSIKSASDRNTALGQVKYKSQSEDVVEHGTDYLLVVIVLSSLKGRERRDAIRNSWMQGYETRTPPVLIKFAIGTLEQPSMVIDSLQSENDLHHDLLLLPDLKEDYSNLTRKVLHSFIWADSHLQYSYLMKCDDDTFLVLDTIVSELLERATTNALYWGFFDGRATAKKRGKWAEKDWYLCDRYLPYALGGGYVISSDLVRRISLNADGLQLYNSEEVSMGVWLSPYIAERKHDVRFNTEFVSRGCRNSYIVSHKQSVQDMTSKQALLKASGVQCEREFQTRKSYQYDWEVLPSQCCERQPDIT